MFFCSYEKSVDGVDALSAWSIKIEMIEIAVGYHYS
jgi:hypothetical protein